MYGDVGSILSPPWDAVHVDVDERHGADTAPDLFQPRLGQHIGRRAACITPCVFSLRHVECEFLAQFHCYVVLFLGCCVQFAVFAMLLSEYHHCRREIPRRAREIRLDGLVGFASATTFELLSVRGHDLYDARGSSAAGRAQVPNCGLLVIIIIIIIIVIVVVVVVSRL